MGGPGERIRVRRLADGAQPVERARERELGGTESVHEVAAPDAAGLLEGAEHGVHRAEPALDPLADHCLAGEHAVPFEQGKALGVEPLRRGRGGRFHERPPTCRLGRAERGQAARPLPRVPTGPLPAQRTQGREGVVRDLAGPHEVPQRVEHLAVGAAAGGRVDLAVERGAAAGQVLADRVVARAGGPLGLVGGRGRPERFRDPGGTGQCARRRGRGSRAPPSRPRRATPARPAAAAGSRGCGPGGHRARGPTPGSQGPRAGRRRSRGARGRPSHGTGTRCSPPRRSRATRAGTGRALPDRPARPRAAGAPATAGGAAAARPGRTTRARRRPAGTHPEGSCPPRAAVRAHPPRPAGASPSAAPARASGTDRGSAPSGRAARRAR